MPSERFLFADRGRSMASMNRDEISRLELLHAAHPDGLVFPHLADAYRRAGRYAQAETVLNAGLRHHSDYSSAHVVLGRLRLDQGKHTEAEDAFRRVLELDPENQVALESLGQVSVEQGRLEDALEQFRRLAQLKPSEEVRDRVRELEQRVSELRQGERPVNGAPIGAAGEPKPAPPGNGTGSPAGPPRQDEAAVPSLPEPGEVVTETMAELYTRQGLDDRAAAVYRQLLERSPGDARLRSKLEAVAGRPENAPDPAPDPAPAAAVPPEPEPAPMAAPPPEPRPTAPAPATPTAQAPAAQVPAAPAPPTDSGPTVAEYLGGVLEWELTEGDDAEGDDAEPADDSGPSPEPVIAGDAGLGEATAVDEPTLTERTRTEATRTEATVAERIAEPVEGEDGFDETGAMARSLIAMTDMLVGLLEYRDPFFRGSSSLTRLMAENVADEMGLSRRERLDLSLSAVLRDLGRLAMGGRLVSTKGHQTPEGRRKIERHVDLALHLLEGIELPRRVRLAVRHHHERWDGAGYPDGLSGEAIPHLARVLAVVDSFTAMVSPRSYRLPRKVPDAARELRDAAGSQYDPAVVEALMRVLERQEQPRLGFVQRPHILMVNPDQPGAVVTAAKLCSAGYLAEVSADTAGARERLRRVPVAALVVSAEAGEEAAAAFVREIRVNPTFSALPVVVVDADSVALRVRLLESGADVCFPPGTSYAELQGTLGALVRRTMRSGGAGEAEGAAESQEAPWLALQGDVKDFPLTWLLQVMKYDSRTAAVGIRTGTADGAIYLQKGDAVHAQIRGGTKGEPALRQMLQWGEGRFTVQPDARPREHTIQTSIMHLLLTQAVDEDHAAAGIFGAVSDEG